MCVKNDISRSHINSLSLPMYQVSYEVLLSLIILPQKLLLFSFYKQRRDVQENKIDFPNPGR